MLESRQGSVVIWNESLKHGEVQPFDSNFAEDIEVNCKNAFKSRILLPQKSMQYINIISKNNTLRIDNGSTGINKESFIYTHTHTHTNTQIDSLSNCQARIFILLINDFLMNNFELNRLYSNTVVHSNTRLFTFKLIVDI